MGLMTTWGAENRVIEQGLTITYSMSKVSGRTIWWTKVYEYHRYAQAYYKYVGMDFATATACAQSMIEKYTRPYTTAKWDENSYAYSNQTSGTRCMAGISIQKTQGHMYEVSVSVNEDDSKMSYSPTSADTLFRTENQRDYDGLNGEEEEEA